ncbi:MAG TPA: IS1634 family transposase [Peptococcaceae bacterium]|nr:IS1634 family transposase [Peptococcaceae bacterium]
MRLSVSRSKNAASLYVIESTYINGVHSSKIVEKLGTYDELKKKLGGQDPYEWAKEYIAELNKLDKENKRKVLVPYSPNKLIPKGEQRSFNGGYLFLQKIYHQLKLDEICNNISDRHKFSFDLNQILSRLLYGRILFPASKLSTFRLSGCFLEQPTFDLQHVYRALEVIAQESDFIQAEVYKNSRSVQQRNAGILFYDCTNYFFEIEQADGDKQYGYSKEHRPNPIVQMGLFIDNDGLPLSFGIFPGNTNEQVTLKPLEKKILRDFELSKIVVCTDAGLALTDNRKFNDKQGRAFITTQSVKKLKKHLKEWALAPDGWRIVGKKKLYDLSSLDGTEDKENVYYKERWINEDGLEQRMIVTFSPKYRDYQRRIREAQIDRAKKLISTNPTKLKKANQNDYKRFVKKMSVTKDGEVAGKEIYTIDNALIAGEEVYDGFYGVCTNLDDDVSAIIAVNRRRWQIEECFRIMKSEFKARPVYLSRDDRIKAHFTTCFLALLIYRILEKKLEDKYTCSEIIDGLVDMNFFELKGEGYSPSYTRTDFTDSLHDAFGFRTDYEITTSSQMKKIFKLTQKR